VEKGRQMGRISGSVILVLAAVAVVPGSSLYSIQCSQREGEIMSEETKAVATPGVKDVNITVLYDNNPYKEGLGTAWGFACVISGIEKTILFDTGGDGSMLLDNMRKLAIEANSIDIVVLSHIHGDHTGGLERFLGKDAQVTVYLPKAFPTNYKEKVKGYGARIVEVEQSLKICEDVYSTGQLGKLIKEQALVIRTDKGLVVITGCAHPGIVKIVRTARDLLKDDILLVMGGFHLEWATKGKIERIISAFEKLDVRYAGPGHCTGEKARGLFEKHFGKNYINIGAGKTTTLADLH
jgi:7,8-dihydropterin-6-yl-methyl-4-(beta-D-ribofuranosyl)aminobenzene 5'-phosphate synthase